MALTGKGAVEYERRRELRKQELAKAPKTGEAVGSSLRNLTRQEPQLGYFTEGDMKAKKLKARCMRLAGRAHVVGNTAFAFGRDGICTVLDQGNARVDFQIMLETLKGAVEINDDGIEVPLVEPTLSDVAALAAAGDKPLILDAPPVDFVAESVSEPENVTDDLPVEEDLPVEDPVLVEEPPVEVVPESKPSERTETRRKPAKNK